MCRLNVSILIISMGINLEGFLTAFDIENSVGFMIAKVHQRLYARLRDVLDPFGITPPQFVLLAFLWKRDGLSQTELSEKTDVDRTTIGGLLDRLEKAGLVKRSPNPLDRRAYLIHLTEAGRALEPELKALAVKVREDFCAALQPGDYAQLMTLLQKLKGGDGNA